MLRRRCNSGSPPPLVAKVQPIEDESFAAALSQAAAPFFRNLFRRRGQKHFWGLPRPPDVELDSKGKGDFEGLGETEGGGRGQLLRERAQTATEHYCVMPKGETEHTNISQQRQHWAKCVLCLSDVVVPDGFLTRLHFSQKGANRANTSNLGKTIAFCFMKYSSGSF